MKKQTKIFDKHGALIRRENPITLEQYIEFDRIAPGQKLYLGKFSKIGVPVYSVSFFVGDATPYHEASTNDAGFGWSECNHMNLIVLEVHDFNI